LTPNLLQGLYFNIAVIELKLALSASQELPFPIKKAIPEIQLGRGIVLDAVEYILLSIDYLAKVEIFEALVSRFWYP
jgi:hypothetical protein